VIHVLAPHVGLFGVADFVKLDVPALAGLISVRSYEEALTGAAFPPGAYVFTALDQLTETETELVTRLHERLAAAAPGLPRLNHPARWLRRGALLDAAFDAGVNPFRARRLSASGNLRFPVFLRSESQHSGSLSTLLHDRGAIRRAVIAALLRGHRYRDLLLVEYCHTADDSGRFRKYSAMIIGTQIVPRSLTTSPEWVTKVHGRYTDDAAAAADRDYVTTNPHEAWLRRVAELGGVEYGRVDYSLLEGRPVLWEINTNPTIGGHEGYVFSDPWPVPNRAGNLLAYQKIQAALELLAGSAREGLDRGTPLPLPVSAAERRRLERERARRDRLLEGRTALARAIMPLRLARRVIRRTIGR
jgi:hypothetical protein